ncbi:unnamed protein product [Cercopithifilaria johnstoni]|uniref:Uncharacterized protein n=1 Tax=Cercopithifilaria johnstoni TaxID=2874296 RepID=A0A8J2MQV2_9BILA|nr:unnamed protein product [Cercopithifilaria johnstoni]
MIHMNTERTEDEMHLRECCYSINYIYFPCHTVLEATCSTTNPSTSPEEHETICSTTNSSTSECFDRLILGTAEAKTIRCQHKIVEWNHLEEATEFECQTQLRLTLVDTEVA